MLIWKQIRFLLVKRIVIQKYQLKLLFCNLKMVY